MATPIRRTLEYTRIAALPRRTITRADADAWAHALLDECRIAGSGATFLRWQALALAECAENDGGFLGLPVGQGKTLIFELLPRVMGAKRAVLIVPSPGLRDKTRKDRRSLAGQWRLPNPPARILTMTELTRESNAKLLEQLDPDLIMVDESHRGSNLGSSVPKRIDRYLEKREQDGRRCMYVCGSGTPARGSIMGFWHHLRWALGDRAPVPATRAEAELWDSVLSEGFRRDMGRRPDPGVLGATPDAAREWFCERLTQTAGVVIIDEDSAEGIPLHVEIQLAPDDRELDGHFATLGLKMENPDGQPVTDPLSRWRFDAQLGAGVYKVLDPAPPEDWRTARRAVAKFVRMVIARSPKHDTEAQVLRAHAEHPIVAEWRRVKGSYTESTRDVWVSDVTLKHVIAWIRAQKTPVIVWTGIVEFGERLARDARLPYYGAQGRDVKTGRHLSDADPTKSMVCSWYANKEGFNLQAWPRQMITQPPSSAQYVEQIIGRARRTGQTRGVHIEWLATSGQSLDSFEKLLKEAGLSRGIVALTQQIERATIVRAVPTITSSNKYRWARK